MGANLRSASMTNANLSAAALMSANLAAANLTGANLFLANFRGANFRLTTLRNGVVSSDKPYWWSLQSESLKDCDKFTSEDARGTTCYIE